MDPIPCQLYRSVNHWSQNTPHMQVHPRSLDICWQKHFPRSLSEVWQPMYKTFLHKGRRRKGGRGRLSTLTEGGGPDPEGLMWYQQSDFSGLSSPFISNLFHLKLIFPLPEIQNLQPWGQFYVFIFSHQKCNRTEIMAEGNLANSQLTDTHPPLT